MELKTLKQQMVALIVGIVVVMIVVFTIASYVIANNLLEASAKDDLEIIIREVADLIESETNTGLIQLREIAKRARIVGTDLTIEQKALALKPDINPNSADAFFKMAIADRSGKAYFEDGETLDIGNKEYYKESLNGKEVISNPVVTQLPGYEGKIVMTFSVPIYVNGQITGIILGIKTVDSLNAVIHKIQLGTTGRIYIIDQEGIMIANTKNPEYVTERKSIIEMAKTDPKLQKQAEANQEMITGKIGATEITTSDGVDSLMSYANITNGTGWSVAGIISKAELLDESKTLLWLLLGIGTIMIVISIIVGLVPVSKIANRLRGLAQSLEEVSSIVVNSIGQISNGNQLLADGATKQAAATEETSSTMNEASVNMQEINSKANEASKSTHEASTILSTVGVDKVNILIDSMKEISKSSDEISRIVKTIDDIAFQTNILALNAAVEAARAGDAGKGFAVVAEEVRSLASKSAEAAKETTEIIENNLNLSKKGVSHSEEISQFIKEVSQAASNVSVMLKEVVGTIDQQTTGFGQINMAVTEMQEVTQNNASVAEESASISEELNTQALELEKIVKELEKLSGGGEPS